MWNEWHEFDTERQTRMNRARKQYEKEVFTDREWSKLMYETDKCMNK